MTHSVNHVEDTSTEDRPTQFSVACLELIGGHTPRQGLDVEDTRDTLEADTVDLVIGDILDILETSFSDTVTEDDLVDIASGLATSLHFALGRLERQQDDTGSEIRRLDREFDGSEIKDSQLIQQTNLMRHTEARIHGVELMRDTLVEHLQTRFSHIWHPPRGNHVSKGRPLHASIVEAKDFIKAREAQRNAALMPEGSRIGFAGGKDATSVDAIWKVLDNAKTRHPDMVLVHGGAKGAETIASKWADNRGVAQIVCTPDWKNHGKAAPFRRNDEMLKLGLIGLVAVPGNGITDNLVDKAKERRIAVKSIAA